MAVPAELERERAERFRRLHEEESEIVVLPGVWDVASARVFEAEGFPALGTTSTGIRWSLGDREGDWGPFLAASEWIAAATDLPVSFDIEAGFAESPEAVRDHVRDAIEAGACGINLEDGLSGGALADAAILEAKIRAIRELCAELGYPLFVNARTDVFLGGPADVAEAASRGRRYADAGADCVFVPGLVDPAGIAALVQEIPVPVNIYALPGVPPVAELAKLGVRRVSVGCGPMQSLLARARTIARALRDPGDYGAFTDDWIPPAEAHALCLGGRR